MSFGCLMYVIIMNAAIVACTWWLCSFSDGGQTVLDSRVSAWRRFVHSTLKRSKWTAAVFVWHVNVGQSVHIASLMPIQQSHSTEVTVLCLQCILLVEWQTEITVLQLREGKSLTFHCWCNKSLKWRHVSVMPRQYSLSLFYSAIIWCMFVALV